MKRCTVVTTTLFALCLSVPAARADFWVEQGQAGSLPGNAQYVTGVTPLTGIKGTLLTANDVNLYGIMITDPTNFSATTVGTAGTLSGTHLFLLDSTGHGVYSNIDATTNAGRSTLPANNANGPKTAGLYFLGIASFGRDPISAPTNDLIFPDFPFTGVFGPTGPGGANPISGYGGAGSATGTYTINLTGAAATVPEPSSLLLLGIGVGCAAALGYRRRKRVKAA
jgi:hypothetical protein